MRKRALFFLLCCLFVSAVAHAEYPLEGLISYYSFNDPSDPTKDLTGAHNGVNHGAEYVADGKIGGAFKFNGRDYIDLGEGDGDFDLFANTKMTIAMWVKPEDPSSPPPFWDFSLLTKNKLNEYSGWHINFGYMSGEPVIDNIALSKLYQSNALSPYIVGLYDFSLNHWYHIVIVIDGDNSAIYINGEEVGSYSRKNNMDLRNTNNSYNLVIGAHPLNASTSCFGTIDEVFIYNRALLEEEVQLIYQFVFNAPPVANAGPDQFLTADISGSALVTLDGSASSDADSSPGTNDDIVNFEWFENGNLIGQGESIQVQMEVGEHEITLIVMDSEGEISEDMVLISIEAAAISGDLDGDGDCDYYDFIIMQNCLGSYNGGLHYIPEADFDEDGFITEHDMNIFISLHPDNMPLDQLCGTATIDSIVIKGFNDDDVPILETDVLFDIIFDTGEGPFLISAEAYGTQLGIALLEAYEGQIAVNVCLDVMPFIPVSFWVYSVTF